MAQNGEMIILVDAFAQIYRGFYAVRNLTNSQGQPTNAVFALAKFLLKMQREYHPLRGAFVFDCGKPAFRLELAPDYKANRQPMPEELKSQLPYINRLIGAFGWPSFSMEGFEADDLLAAMAVDFTDAPVRIVSGDKDIHQVISDRVRMLTPDPKGGLLERGPTEVIEKFGVTPAQVIDYLALIGDNSDNIPGVPGIGPKTAADLLNKHTGIDAMLAAPSLIANPKQREKIVACEDILRRNQKLIRLKTETPSHPWCEADRIKRREPDWTELLSITKELELRSLTRELEELSGGTVGETSDVTDLFTSAPAAPPPRREVQTEQPDLFGL